MQLLPLFINLSGRKVLVVGGGAIAYQKVLLLLPTGASITVMTEETGDAMDTLVQQNQAQITLIGGKRLDSESLNPDDLKDYDLIIAATNDSRINALVVSVARALRIWVNSVDDPAHCDFYTTSTVDKGPIRIAISSEGKFPGLCAAIRKVLDVVLPDEHIPEFTALAQLRTAVKGKFDDPGIRGRILRGICRQVEKEYFNLNLIDDH